MRQFFILAILSASVGLQPLAIAGADGETSSKNRAASASKARTFTLDQAIQTALRQNPTVLNAIQEIKRTKGVIIQIRAEALPHISPNFTYQWTDPNLGSSGGGIVGGVSAGRGLRSDLFYNIRVTGTQLIFNGTTWPAIRGSFFQRDSAYFALRNIVDQTIATVKTQFYQIVVNRELVKVNEENVRLLEAQLKDQQNRFEAGTVPRFNVLQADVQLHNQLPNLITAQNNLRISKITLAKTLGLNFQPRRGENPPLEVVGEMPYFPRTIALANAIELGKERRPFLKQARANVLNQLQQVRATAGQYLPTITTTGGGEWVSSPTNSSWHDISKGWIATVQGSLPIWDSGAIAGQVLQQRALLFEAKNTYDDDVRQVELEIQQAYSNLLQNQELVTSQEKNVELAEEALRLAKARLDAGAGTQLDVLNATVQLLMAQSTRLQALFGYNSSLAEFDRATGAQSTYHEMFADLAPRATKTKTYYTGSNVDALGKPKNKGDDP
jgi:outer membrane protein TolC